MELLGEGVKPTVLAIQSSNGVGFRASTSPSQQRQVRRRTRWERNKIQQDNARGFELSQAGGGRQPTSNSLGTPPQRLLVWKGIAPTETGNTTL